VEATCDRVVFVKRGRVVEQRRLSAPAEVLDVEIRVGLPPEARVLQGLSRFGTEIVQPRPDLIALRIGSEAAVPAIVSWLVQQGVQIHAVQPHRKSLEDVFLDVMGDDERPG
jgi:ABC-2 type transport system ATP-binding protein